MNIKLKEYINSAFSEFLYQSTDSKFTRQDFPKTAKSEVKRSYLNEEKLSALWDSESMTHLIELFLWPCNAFALCSSLITKHGGYRLLVSPEKTSSWTLADTEEVIKVGKKWRDFINTDLKNIGTFDVSEINDLLLSVFEYKNLNISVDDLTKDPEFKKSLLKICLCADESFKDVTVLSPIDSSISGRVVEFLILNNEEYEFQLAFTNKSFGTVHYKSTICQSGISINSVTNKLTLISPEITLKYVERLKDDRWAKRDNYNVLILPWPLKVDRTDFNEVSGSKVQEMDSDFGFFEYSPKMSKDKENVDSILDEFFKEFDEVDLVVLPECALQSAQAELFFDEIRLYCETNGKYIPTFISGVYERGEEHKFGVNALKLFTVSGQHNGEEIEPSTAVDYVEQHKHHRWFLDRAQLHNYKLGNRLSPKRKWWEFTKVDERSLISYYCQRQDIQVSPLICEDLARQDPVAPVIRALGPNLIIALLLDGPQIKTRWPGRYASLLSEDPGSSVLSITPLGMTMRSDGTGFPPSRTVGFWSESNGSYRELSLNEGKRAIVLTLEPNRQSQWSADGRKSERVMLNYAGHLCI